LSWPFALNPLGWGGGRGRANIGVNVKISLKYIQKTFQEKEYELSEVFENNVDIVEKAEVLSMSKVNKYAYQIDEDQKVSKST